MSGDGVSIDRQLLRSMPLPQLPRDSDKNARGQVLVVSGGPRVPGVPLLTGIAALRVGAGKLQLASPSSSAVALGLAAPEAAIVRVQTDADGEIGLQAFDALSDLAQAADAVAIGPGMMGGDVAALAARLLEAARETAFVIDAGALKDLLDHLPREGHAEQSWVATPHAGEMAGLLGWRKSAVQADPKRAARSAAERLGAVVALKGETTYVASPTGELWIHEGGVAGLGASGSGDVLAGFIAGFLARGANAATATIWGVSLHGRIGECLAQTIGPLGFLARELLDAAPGALARLCAD